jgi:hypothetical protein
MAIDLKDPELQQMQSELTGTGGAKRIAPFPDVSVYEVVALEFTGRRTVNVHYRLKPSKRPAK